MTKPWKRLKIDRHETQVICEACKGPVTIYEEDDPTVGSFTQEKKLKLVCTYCRRRVIFVENFELSNVDLTGEGDGS